MGQLCSLENGKKVENLHLPLLDAKFLRAQRTATLISKGIKVEKGELVILVDGENSGEVFIAPENGFLGSTFKKLFITPEIYREYTLIILKFYQNLFRNSKRGAAIPHLDKHLFHDLLIGLPPLEEQKLIVARIEVLEPLIEDYDQAETELSKLNETFPEQIKKSILQYAIQGKLVPQNPSDEPASVLLDKIKTEKRKLIKAGKIKKDKVESYIYKRDNRHYEKIGDKEVDITDEIPFEIPDSWAWIRLGNISQLNPKNEASNAQIASFIPMNMLDGGYLNSYRYECQPWEKIKKGFTHFSQGDIVVAKITPCFQNRKSAILYKLQGGFGAGTTELHVVRCYKPIIQEYILWIFKTEQFITQGINNFTGTAGQQRINRSFMEHYLIPLPPIHEQQRIVEKIEQLFKTLP